MKTFKHLFVLILLFFLSPFQLLFAQVVSEGLQTYYDFNGNTEDKSGNDLHGIALDLEATVGIENASNTAYLFNGSTSNIDCGNEGRNITDQLTISSWIKTSSLDRQLFVTKYNSDEDIGYFLATENGNAIVGGRDNSGNFWQAISTTSINDGEWHHVVGIVDQNKWQIWVDCFLEDEITTSTSTSYLNCIDPLTIGYWYQGNGLGDYRYFDGLIDEIRLYNRPLDLNELDTLCNIEIYTSINKEISTNNDFSIFPNPSNSVLIVKSSVYDQSRLFGYVIYNNSGQIMDSGKINIGQQLNIVQLPQGQYTLQLFSNSDFGKVIFTTSFIKMRA